MEVKKVRITNRAQFESLVSMMEEHPPVARGLKYCEAMKITKPVYTEIWGKISKKLNSLGPPIRSIVEWQKVWADHRQAIKNKLAKNKRESQATGGGPNQMQPLSASEEAVVRLLALDVAVNDSGPVFGLQPDGSSSPRPLSASPSFRDLPSTPQQISTQDWPNENDSELENYGENIENVDILNQNNSNRGVRNLPVPRNRKRKKEEDESRIGMLTKQTDNMKKIAEDVSEIARYTRKMYKLKEEHYRKKQSYMLEKEKNKCEELQFKMQLLEYKKRKLELLERTE